MSGIEFLTNEARRLIDEAGEHEMVLRAIGSVAIQLHCAPSSQAMGRIARVPKDIDLVARKKDRAKLASFFEGQGYKTDRDMLVAMEGTRYLFRNPESDIDVDVWIDELNLCHKIDVRRRMGGGPTLPIEDLLLSKLQIVDLTPSDFGDLDCMLDTHEVAEHSSDPEIIDLSYVCGILGSDWGFWKTATDNLSKLKPHLGPLAAERVEVLLQVIEATPKTTGWKLRSLVGEKKQWWQDVDIPRDTY